MADQTGAGRLGLEMNVLLPVMPIPIEVLEGWRASSDNDHPPSSKDGQAARRAARSAW